MSRTLIIVVALMAATPALAQNIEKTDTYEYVMAQPYPVVQGDITNRPYRVVGHVTKSLRKATVFSKNATFEKVQKELWERARKLNADAVINASFGEFQKNSWTFGSREARGVAIKFLTDAEIAALPKSTHVDRPTAAVPLPEEAKLSVVTSMKDRMFDGETARWRWPDRIEGEDFYCGFVNAKNRFGAYVGFKPFMTMLMQGTKGWVSAPIDIGATENAEIVVREQCLKNGYSLSQVPPE